MTVYFVLSPSDVSAIQADQVPSISEREPVATVVVSSSSSNPKRAHPVEVTVVNASKQTVEPIEEIFLKMMNYSFIGW